MLHLKMPRVKLLLVVGAVGSLALLTGIAYAFTLSPFKEKGEIKADEVCATLGPSSSAAGVLRKVLPEEPSYSFDNDVKPRTDVRETGYESSCFVSGGGQQLLVAEARLIPDESATSWTDWVEGTAAKNASVASLTPFPAGKTAVASTRFAAIFTPCASAGKAPGGQ